MIDWEGILYVLKKAGPIKKNKLIQVLHNWQNVGRQKKFRDAKLDKDVTPAPMPTEEEKTIYMCPNGCGETEGNLHYVHYQDKTVIKKRGEVRERFNKKLHGR